MIIYNYPYIHQQACRVPCPGDIHSFHIQFGGEAGTHEEHKKRYGNGRGTHFLFFVFNK